jgi:Ni,Fe-hydrogenase I large subunit
VTEKPAADKIAAYGALLQRLQTFINTVYLPDVLAVAGSFPEYFKIARGCGNFMSYGGFSESDDNSRTFLPGGVIVGGRAEPVDIGRITEDVKYANFSSPSGLRPADGETIAAPRKEGAYSWLKAPRYGGLPVEVGPLARMLVAYRAGMPAVVSQIDAVLAATKAAPEDLASVMGRHAARAIECKLVADRCETWLNELSPGADSSVEFTIPPTGQGVGLMEAPRGALGHWLAIKDGKISRYQCVVPTTWNCSPRDDRGVAGPVEQALVGTPIADPANPIEATRVVRSFDPCIACAVH